MTSVTMDTLKTLTKAKPQRPTNGGRFKKSRRRFATTLLRVVQDCGPDVTLNRLMKRFEAAHLICLQRKNADRNAKQRADKAERLGSNAKILIELTKLERSGYAASHVIIKTVNGQPEELMGWNVTAWGRRLL